MGEETREASVSIPALGDAPVSETASAPACASPAGVVVEGSGVAGSVRVTRPCNPTVACPPCVAGSTVRPGACATSGSIHSSASSSGAGLPVSSPTPGPATPAECAGGPPRESGKSLLATGAMADLAVRSLAALPDADVDDVCSFLEFRATEGVSTVMDLRLLVAPRFAG